LSETAYAPAQGQTNTDVTSLTRHADYRTFRRASIGGTSRQPVANPRIATEAWRVMGETITLTPSSGELRGCRQAGPTFESSLQDFRRWFEWLQPSSHLGYAAFLASVADHWSLADQALHPPSRLPGDVRKYSRSKGIDNYLELALRLVREKFDPPEFVECSLASDPESGSEWVVVKVGVRADRVDVRAARKAFTASWVSQVPAEYRLRIRLSPDIV
jgi:hypothetical protein